MSSIPALLITAERGGIRGSQALRTPTLHQILLWDTRTCKYLARVESHTDSVRELSAVSTTPGYLTSVGDQSIKVSLVTYPVTYIIIIHLKKIK